MSGDTKRFGAEVPRDVVEVADERLEYGDRQEIIEEVVRAIAAGDKRPKEAALDVRIRQVRERLEDAKSKKEQARREIKEHEDELDQLREQREKTLTEEEELEQRLIVLEDSLHDGTRILEDSGPVQRMAEEFEIEPEEIINTLKERNPDVPDYAFQPAMMDTENWDGVHTTPSKNNRSSRTGGM